MNRRLVQGFLIAPLAPCVLAATVASVAHGHIAAIPFAALLYAVFAYPLAFALGIPAYLVLSRSGWVSLPRVAWAGFVLGGVCGILIPLMLGAEWQSVFVLGGSMTTGIAVFGLHGLLAASVFWWVALRPRD